MKALVILLAVFGPLCAVAAEDFDFALVANECKSTIAFTKLAEAALRTIDSDKPVLLCKRNSKQLTCEYSYEDSKEKTKSVTYQIIADSPPFLVFADESKSEVALVNTNELAAAYRSAIFETGYVGSKVCSMAFLTQDQFKALKKN